MGAFPFLYHSISWSLFTAISFSNSSIRILIIADQGGFLYYKTLPLLRLVQRCSGNLALSPPLPCSPKALFFLHKQHVASFPRPGRRICTIVCAQGYCCYLLFQQEQPLRAGENKARGFPRSPLMQKDRAERERDKRDAARSSSIAAPPSPPIQGAGAGL